MKLALSCHPCQPPGMHSQGILLEVCCGSAAVALQAATAGAGRVELCDNLVEGGTTPSHGAVEVAVAQAGVPVMAMVRPRGGDFLYSDVDFDVMLRDVHHMKRLGASGVVFGILDADGRVDRERSLRLIEAARPLSVTFHRAFDVSRNLEESLDALIALGVDRVLTSVGRPAVTDDLGRLQALIERADGRLLVLPGGGVTPDNVTSVAAVPGVSEVHIGASRRVASAMTHRVHDVVMGRAYTPDEYALEEADASAIVSTVRLLSDGAPGSPEASSSSGNGVAAR